MRARLGLVIGIILGLTVFFAVWVHLRRDHPPQAGPVTTAPSAALPTTAPNPSPADEPAPEGRSIAVTVIDAATKVPLGDAPVLVVMDGRPRSEHADAKGRIWIMLGAKDPQALVLIPSHPDYAIAPLRLADPGHNRPLPTQCTLELVRGVDVSGQVTDGDGKPVADAVVALSMAELAGLPEPRVQCDEKGAYRFERLRPGPIAMIAQAQGRAPDGRQFIVAAGMAAVDFKLSSGKALRAQVVDEDDVPIPGAWVRPEEWRGQHTLDFRSKTDAQGRFAWLNAPSDPASWSFVADGFQWKSGVILTPSDDELKITLIRPPSLSGTVVNAETGQPIPAFHVFLGVKHPSSPQPSWFRAKPQKLFEAGSYSVRLADATLSQAARIEADGYLPAVLPPAPGGKSRKWDVKLVKGKEISGIVLMPDGKPASGAQVVLVGEGSVGSVTVEKGHAWGGGQPLDTLTQENGEFSLPPQTDYDGLVIVHPAGCAMLPRAEVDKGGPYKLLAYGRIELSFKSAGQPFAGKSITASTFTSVAKGKSVFFNYHATTDEAGRITLDGVAPGTAQLSRVTPMEIAGRVVNGGSNIGQVEVKPGQTTRSEFAMNARRVIGRIVVPEELAEAGWKIGYTELPSVYQPPPYPENWPDMTFAEQQAWSKAFYASDAGRAANQRSMRRRTIYPKPDGSFQVSDIEPGNYILKASIQMGANRGAVNNPPAALSLPVKIEVGDINLPMDLGTLDMVRIRELKVGDDAPAFEGKTHDGKPLKLSDYRGKWVLLEFFVPSMRRAVEETRIKETVRKLAGDYGVETISICVDDASPQLDRYIQKCGITWPVVPIGHMSFNRAQFEFGVRFSIGTILVSPEGKVVTLTYPMQGAENFVKRAVGR